MKYAVIDIGSNSVRLMISCDGISGDKDVITTKLAEGMRGGYLEIGAMQRTVAAISFLCKKAKDCLVDKLYVFATAAVRKAKNRDEFLIEVKNECGVDVDVVSGDLEGKLGYVGALAGKDGGIIDVGGASTEITVVAGGVQLYVKSVDVGAVSVKDCCGQDKIKAEAFLLGQVKEYGEVPKTEFYAIGGTATSVAAILQELDPYDPKKVDGFLINKNQLISLKDRLYDLSVEERKELKGLRSERAEVIASGVAILCAVIEKLGVDKIIVSEKDNLEGYLKLKRDKNE